METFNKARQRLSSTPLAIRVAGLYLIAALVVIGSLLMREAVLSYKLSQQNTLGASQTQPSLPESQPTYVGSPDRLVIERLGINLAIKPGAYDRETSEWTLTDTDAFFATITDMPNDERGSTFIYGHNRPQAFEPLKDITNGDIVKIRTKNGLEFTYEYRRDAVVEPTVTKVLTEDPEDPQLVLMTCEGVWNEVRRMMYFSLKEVKNA